MLKKFLQLDEQKNCTFANNSAIACSMVGCFSAAEYDK